MKKLISFLFVFVFISSSAFCQYSYTPIDFPKFYTVKRSVYIKFFQDKRKMLFVDNKEGLSVNCDSINSDKTQTEEFDFFQSSFFDKFWNVYDQNIDVGILAYIPAGQDLDNWQEMISIQRIDAEGQSSKKLYNMLVKTREKRCPGKTQFEIIEENGKSILYKAISDKCGDFESQAELSIILAPPKLLMMQYTLWKVEYVVRAADWEPLLSNEKLEWLKNIVLLTGKDLDAYTDTN